MNKFKKSIVANGVFGAMLIAIERIGRQVFSKLIASSFHSAGSLSIHPTCRILGARYICIGDQFVAGRGLWLQAVYKEQGRSYSPRITIGDFVSVGEYVHISCANIVTIGNRTLIGSKVHITDHNHGRYSGSEQSTPKEPPITRTLGLKATEIESDVWIGENVVILPGARIGQGSIVAANSIVTGEVPRNVIVAGSPAKPIKYFDSVTGKWERSRSL